MSWTVVATVCTSVGVPLGILGTIVSVRTNRREAVEARAKTLRDHDAAMKARYDTGVVDGLAHAEPAAALLRSQRDDARRERDNERAERLAAERRVQELEDQLRPRPGRA